MGINTAAAIVGGENVRTAGLPLPAALRSTGATPAAATTQGATRADKSALPFADDALDANRKAPETDVTDFLGEPPVPPPDVRLTGGAKHEPRANCYGARATALTSPTPRS